jgi:hypothetical protein
VNNENKNLDFVLHCTHLFVSLQAELKTEISILRIMAKIIVQNTEITVLSQDDKDYISLTDMANGKQSESRAADIIKNWIRTRYTIEFLGTWEMIHNPNFKVVEFDHFRMQ